MENHSSELQRQGSLQARKRQPTVPPLQLLTFKVGTLTLALPLQSIYKVTYYKAIYSNGLNAVGVTQMDDHDVTVIDLHQHLFKSPLPSPAATTRPCLIVVQDPNQELHGLLTAGAPTLIDMPPANIRVLPEAYRRADTLGIASHVAIAPQGDTKLTIFLLDMGLLLQHSAAQN
ncbi:MAG: chemotaxis protein CheW [Cyanobacteria bacterium J06626_18]